VVLYANAWGGFGASIDRVMFYEGDHLLGQMTEPPYRWVWHSAPFGSYDLRAQALDSNGAVLVSDPVHVDVGTVLVPAGSVWRYHDQGMDLGQTWTDPAYDDSAWSVGAAELGYGDGDEVTLVNYGLDPNNKPITTYFRHGFTVPNACQITNLICRLRRDDGAVVHLNGSELYRSNMPENEPINAYTRASESASDEEETRFHEVSLPATLWGVGDNLLAVEVHQRSPSSSDLSFDLELHGFGSATAESIPDLQYQWNGQILRLCWPAQLVEWEVWEASRLMGPWSPVMEMPVLSHGIYFIDLLPEQDRRFYRLLRR
jgi:hypothetical protein